MRRRAGIVLLASVIGVLATARLGFWQLDRAATKVAMQSAFDSRAALPILDSAALADNAPAAALQHYRHVRLRGRWLPEHTVFLDNRQMNGRPGFYVVTPLQLEHRVNAVLVQRGWVPRNKLERTLVPVPVTPAGPVEVDGVIAPPPARLYEFALAASGALRQNLDLDHFSSETGLALRPLSILQVDSAATFGDGLLRQWPSPTVDVHKHYGYAFQWFALAALVAGLYVWFQLVRPRLRRRA